MAHNALSNAKNTSAPCTYLTNKYVVGKALIKYRIEAPQSQLCSVLRQKVVNQNPETTVENLHARDPKQYTIASLCRLFGVTKQAFFKYDEISVLKYMAQEAFALEYIRGVRAKDPGMGGKKLWFMYKRDFPEEASLGRDRFEAVIDKYGLKVRKRIRKPKTTDSTHGFYTYPNLVKEYIPLAANQLWVSDITYIVIWTDEDKYEFCFLSIILDAYTEEIVGYSVGATLKTTYPLKALEMALLRLNDGDGRRLIHHSDRGVQYASSDYIDLLKSREIQISMTEGGDPKDNAQAERINNTIKNELLKGYRFTDIEQVRQAVRAAVEFYNTERPHMSIDMRTPAEAYLCSGELVKRWKSYRLQAIKKQHEVLDIPTNVLPLPVCQGSPSGLRPPVNP